MFELHGDLFDSVSTITLVHYVYNEDVCVWCIYMCFIYFYILIFYQIPLYLYFPNDH